MNIIERTELETLIDSGEEFVLLEALPQRYFDDKHLPGARQLDYEHTGALAKKLIPSQDSKVVVYCASAACQNSHKAAAQLESLGYSDVSVYAGGKEDWEAAGREFSKEAA